MIYGSIPSSGISKTKEEDWDTIAIFYCLCDPPLWFLVASFESTLEEHIISWKEGRLDWSGLSDVSLIKLRGFFVGVHNPVSKAKCHHSAKFTQESHGNSWNVMEIHGISWKFMEILGHPSSSSKNFQEFRDGAIPRRGKPYFYPFLIIYSTYTLVISHHLPFVSHSPFRFRRVHLSPFTSQWSLRHGIMLGSWRNSS